MFVLRVLAAAVISALLPACVAAPVDDIHFGATNAATATANATPPRPARRLGTTTRLTTASTTQPVPQSLDLHARRTIKRLTAVSNPSSSSYRLGPFDVLSINVFKVPDLSTSPEVSEAGTINYPLLGEIAVAGKTPRDVERTLATRLGSNYLQNPQVTVTVKEHNSQRITMEGAVKRPGVYPMRGGLSLLQAIATAHGMDQASDNTVLIFRTLNGKRSAARFDIDDIRRGAADDPVLQAGDVVVAGRSAFKDGVRNVLTALRFTSVFALF